MRRTESNTSADGRREASRSRLSKASAVKAEAKELPAASIEEASA
jgi:hypothetical protein